MPVGASGGISGVQFGTPTPATTPTSQFGNPATFTAAANTQASDYDKIMAEYANIVKNASNPISPITAAPVSSTQIENQSPQTFNSISPTQIAASSNVSAPNISAQTTKYNQSGDVTKSLSDLSNLVNTGGYSDADIANIRARDVSPIRSIYANAQQNVDRQRALQGGYSPSFNATQASMARDEANQVADVNTAANAGIAQNVASNKIAAAPSYASASSAANAAQTAADQANTAIINQINQANAANAMQAGEFNTTANNAINQANAANANQVNEYNSTGQSQVDEFNRSLAAQIAQLNAANAQQTGEFNTTSAMDASKTNASNALANQNLALGAVQGQQSLYGTTPALTNMFGNQVVQAGQLGQGQQQINNQRLGTIGNLAGFGRS